MAKTLRNDSRYQVSLSMVGGVATIKVKGEIVHRGAMSTMDALAAYRDVLDQQTIKTILFGDK